MNKERKTCRGLYVCLVFTFFVMAAVPAEIEAEDLIICGTVRVLHGEVEYDKVQITNGGILYVTHYDGSFGTGTGTLTIKARSIFVDAISSINADGVGYRGIENNNGEGPGGGVGGANAYDGGGGGAYGGKGGDGACDYYGGTDGRGGVPYGDADSMTMHMGSAGGAAGSGDGDYGGPGGYGGGLISLQANSIDISGSITANGTDGLIYNNDSSGGGAGGGIILVGNTINLDHARITANGGNGGTLCGGLGCILDDGGGGGSGGRIKFFFHSSLNLYSAGILARGGKGAYLGGNGSNGTYYYKKIPIRATLDIKPDTFKTERSGRYITAYIELPEDFDLNHIIPSSILLNNIVKAELHPIDVGDFDSDNIPDLMVKFPSHTVVLKIFPKDTGLPIRKEVELTISGKLTGGATFTGSDKIRIII